MKNSLFLFLILLFVSCSGRQLTSGGSLPRSTPEAEGVDSEGIVRFLEEIAKSKNELHSFMILRHGKVIAEGWIPPFADTLNHTMFSVTKTFTSTAIGFAVTEKLLSVDDKVISFFPESLPDTISPYLASLTVKDLLIMAPGQDPEPPFSMSDTNSVRTYLAVPLVTEPGKQFKYNSYSSHILSAIIRKVSGQKLRDYLQPRLLGPLGIKGIEWAEDASGNTIGGWGLQAKTEDMAKLGQFYLQKGKWNGKQLLPQAWIEEATTKKIEQEPDWTEEKRAGSDWAQGYCYQIWRNKHGYRADGAFGQFIIVLPEQDMVIAITAFSDNLGFIWQHILPAVHNQALPPNPEGEARIKEKAGSISISLAGAPSHSPLEKTLSGKAYRFFDNEFGMTDVTIEFSGDIFILKATQNGEIYSFNLGRGFLTTTTDPKIQTGSFAWQGDTLRMKTFNINGSSAQLFTLKLDSDKISVKTGNITVNGEIINNNTPE